ncbi:MAG: hypothetical protein IJ560_02375 [Alphaproteobacteria bacterium]|nr:hypothetical protein [Alphaproteobacteria bacterium]
MKKLIISVIAAAALAGCTYYDYYKGDVRYTQDGEDCVYYTNERGRRFNADVRAMDTDKKIVYRNTRCADLFGRDTAGFDTPRVTRSVIAPAAPAVSSCGCHACNAPQPMVRRTTYVMY